ncbi:MAG: class B sortase [Oscillospiraceae bacterium]|nr:class B sortase [Oscillospiraceae bacterium]
MNETKNKEDFKAQDILYIAEEASLGINPENKGSNRFMKTFIPMKGDAVGEIIRKVVFMVSIAAAIVCLVLLLSDKMTEKQEHDLNQELRQMKESSFSKIIELSSDPTTGQVDDGTPRGTFNGTGYVLPQWDELYEINEDIVGWIKIDDTPIDYPVVQRVIYDENGRIVGDNVHYLTHNFEGKYEYSGTIYLDRATPVIDENRPNNAVLYGHNMNNGTKFNYVRNYYPQHFGMDALLNNPTLDFETIYDDERTTYKIFAAIYINTADIHGYVYRYFTKRYYDNEEQFFCFIGNIMDRSVFFTEVDLEYGDEIITLSTCYYPLGSQTDRFVLFARRVRPDEDPTVNVELTYINPSPLYFDYYYRVKGGSWGGRNWDTSLVKGFDESDAFYADSQVLCTCCPRL